MIEQIIADSVAPYAEFDPVQTPQQSLTRHEWQTVAEAVIMRVRMVARQPAFGLGDAELNVLYYRTYGVFDAMIRARLGQKVTVDLSETQQA